MPYVDGFVIPMPKKSLAAYKKLAALACKVWMEHGALSYFETIGEDMTAPCGVPMSKLAKTKPSETVVFAWIVYKNKAARNRINKAVMKDPRIVANMNCPFDVKRMGYGGFKVLVQA
jgi:uncharacterized protein YbaA (DUF1428 family)